MNIINSIFWKGIGMVILLSASSALAIPDLQLDIEGGGYDSSSETIISSNSNFKLYALLSNVDGNSKNSLADTYYISVAIMPNVGASTNLGSFTFNNTPVNVTADMIYGKPSGLEYHSIFDTYYKTFSFSFLTSKTTTPYNSEEDFGGTSGGLNANGTGSYYMDFLVDTSGLNSAYTLHFDLYNPSGGNNGNGTNAPYSHDAQSSLGTPVPEPATMLLFGAGLVGLAGIARRKIQ